MHVEPAPEPANIGSFAVALVWISFSYSGWNAAIYLSSEVQNAARNVPRAMIFGTSIVLVLYVALNALILFSTPAASLKGQVEVAAIAADYLGGPGWENAITIIVALALVTSVSSFIMTGPRVYARMAVDGFLPRMLVPGTEAPRAAIVFQSTIALVLLWTMTFKTLLTYIGFTLSLSTAAAVLGLIKLRLRESETLQITGWPWIPVLFILFILFSATFTIIRQPGEAALGGTTLLAGLIAYTMQRKRQRPAKAQFTQ